MRCTKRITITKEMLIKEVRPELKKTILGDPIPENLSQEDLILLYMFLPDKRLYEVVILLDDTGAALLKGFEAGEKYRTSGDSPFKNFDNMLGLTLMMRVPPDMPFDTPAAEIKQWVHDTLKAHYEGMN